MYEILHAVVTSPYTVTGVCCKQTVSMLIHVKNTEKDVEYKSTITIYHQIFRSTQPECSDIMKYGHVRDNIGPLGCTNNSEVNRLTL